MSLRASITKYDFDKICRTCLELKQGMISLCSSGTDILQMLQILTPIKINENDELPSQICNDCVCRTYETIKFKKQCENSEQCLYEILNDNNDDKKWFKDTSTINNDNNIVERESIKSEKEINHYINNDDIKDELNDNSNDDDLINDFSNSDNDDLDQQQEQEQHQTILIQTNTNNLSLRKSRINWVQSLSIDKCDINQLLCKICSKTLVNISSLARHMETHEQNRKVCATCTICNKGFYENGNYVRHMQRHKRDAKYKCDYCNKSFYELNILSKHLQKHHLNELIEYKCIECNKLFVIKCQYDLHIKLQHKKEYDLKCKYCNKGFIYKNKLLKHLLQHERTYYCELCNKTYKNSSTLRKHNYHCHNLNKLNEKQVCQICGKTVLHMKRHLLYAHSEDNVKCPECCKEFPSTYGLNIHIWKLHKNSSGPRKKPYLCSTCGYTCECRAALKIHYERKHAEVRAYKCQICSKGFKTRTEHIRHVRFTHNTESRPNLKCTICDKQFKRRSALAYHMRYSHTTERRFNCTGCTKQFKTSGTLKIHMRIHTGERPYQCKYCGKAFGQGSTLKTHMKIHATSSIVPTTNQASSTTAVANVVSTTGVATSNIDANNQQANVLVDSTTTNFLLNHS